MEVSYFFLLITLCNYTYVIICIFLSPASILDLNVFLETAIEPDVLFILKRTELGRRNCTKACILWLGISNICSSNV